MADQNSKAEAFRALHVRGTPLVLINIWDAGSARIVTGPAQRRSRPAVGSVANANGFATASKSAAWRSRICGASLP